jgi:tropomyosin, fungi type
VNAEAEVKKLQQELLSKEQEITSLTHRLSLLEEQNEKYEAKLNESKAAAVDAESDRSTKESLTRKVQLLEEELDAAERNSKEVVEKYVVACDMVRWRAIAHHMLWYLSD